MADPGRGGAPPSVHMVVLYWQRGELPLVERCLASLAAQDTDGGALRLRTLVVDNGCGATPSLAGAGAPPPELLRLPENRGFTGGHNAGLRHALAAGADYVFLVNSDVVADPGCVRELVAAARARPGAGILGPLVLSEAAPERVESNGQAFNPWTGRHRELGRGAPPRLVDPSPRRVDGVSGCALLVARAVVEAVGPLDEPLFFYFEDLDWCLRAGRAGFEVLVVPRARVWHRGGGSTGPASPRSTYYSVRNHLVVVARHAHRPLGRLLGPLVLAYHLAFLARSPQRRSRAHLGAALRGAWAAWRGQLGPEPRHARGA